MTNNLNHFVLIWFIELRNLSAHVLKVHLNCFIINLKLRQLSLIDCESFRDDLNYI